MGQGFARALKPPKRGESGEGFGFLSGNLEGRIWWNGEFGRFLLILGRRKRKVWHRMDLPKEKHEGRSLWAEEDGFFLNKEVT